MNRLRHRIPVWLETGAGWSWRLLAIAAALALTGWLLSRVRVVAIPLMLAVVFAAVLDPLHRRLMRVGVPETPSALLTMLAAVTLIGGAFTFIGFQVAGQFEELRTFVVTAWGDIRAWLESGPFGLEAVGLDQLLERAASALREQLPALVGGALGGASAVVEFVAETLLALAFTFFVLRDGRRLVAWLGRRTRAEVRAKAGPIARQTWITLRRYFAGTALIGVVDALIIGGALALLGTPLVLPLAVLVFVGAFIPFVGATVSGFVAALVTLATQGLTDALILTAVVIGTQQLEGDVLAPLVWGRSVDLHPGLVLAALTAGITVGGLLGAFLAVPVVAVGAIVWRHLDPQSQVRGFDLGPTGYLYEKETETMRITEGAGIYSGDEKLGEVHRVVLDPTTAEVSHVVISRGFLFPEERVIAADAIVGERNGDLTVAEHVRPEDLPPFEIEYTVPLDEATASRYGTQRPALFWYGMSAGYPPGVEWWYPVTNRVERSVPEDSSVIETGSRVIAADGESVGKLEELRVHDQDEHLTGLVISEGILGTTRRLIPALWVDQWGENEIRLLVSSKMVEDLPEI